MCRTDSTSYQALGNAVSCHRKYKLSKI
jgi:hypothetical protein